MLRQSPHRTVRGLAESGLCCLAGLFFVLPACLPTLASDVIMDRDRATGMEVIVVGGNRDYPPYELLDKDGKAAGYNVDLTKAIADVMGLKVQFKLGDWSEMRQALERGDVDVLQGMSHSEGPSLFHMGN